VSSAARTDSLLDGQGKADERGLPDEQGKAERGGLPDGLMNSKRLNIVYMGTADFAVPALDALYGTGHRIALVVTQPDRVRGRGGRILPTPVGRYAETNGLSLCKPERLRGNEDFARALAQAAPDLIVVAAYGKLLPVSILDLPSLGCVNIHASLLPEYRGAAPVQRAILDGKSETGVTLMYMAEGLDAGDMIASAAISIDEMNAGELTDALAGLGAELLAAMLPALADGTAPRIPQDDGSATYAEKIGKTDGRLDLYGTAEDAARRVRAMTPSPGAYVLRGDERIVVTAARAIRTDRYEACEAADDADMATCEEVAPGTATCEEAAPEAAPGTALCVSKKGIGVRMGEGILLIEALKMPGKRAMPVAEYLKGNAFDTKELLQ